MTKTVIENSSYTTFISLPCNSAVAKRWVVMLDWTLAPYNRFQRKVRMSRFIVTSTARRMVMVKKTRNAPNREWIASRPHLSARGI